MRADLESHFVRFRKLGMSLLVGLLVTVLIAAVGALLGPTWRPREFTSTLVIETADTAIGGVVTTAPVGTYEFDTVVRSLEVAPGVEERVKIRTPQGAGDSLPAVVFLHGAGTADYMGFALQAEALSSAGIVTVVADKRLDNYSITFRDYRASAADYHRGVELAASLPNVDPARVGIYGESEGAYIAPVLAAEFEEDVAFVVLVSAPVVPPRYQASYAVHTYLTATGVPQDIFRLIPRVLGAVAPFGWINYMDFDPQPYHQRMTQPTLVVFGTGDRSTPQAQGAEQLISDLAVAGNDAVTVRFYEGANHGIRIGDGTGPLAPGFSDDLARWINGLPVTGTAPPQVAGAEPWQPIWADAPLSAPALLSGNMLVAVHLFAPLLLLVGAGTGAAAGVGGVLRSRRNGKSGEVPVDPAEDIAAAATRPLTWLLVIAAALAVATWYAWLRYMWEIAYLALSYQQDLALSFGGYKVENYVAFAAALALGLAVYYWVSEVRGTGRLGRLGRIAVVSTLLGTVILLVLASYWSGFPTFGWGA